MFYEQAAIYNLLYPRFTQKQRIVLGFKQRAIQPELDLGLLLPLHTCACYSIMWNISALFYNCINALASL